MNPVKTRLGHLPPWTRFQMCRDGCIMVKADDGISLDESGMENHYHGLSHVLVLGPITDEDRAALLAKRHPWKPDPNLKPKPNERGPSNTKAMQLMDELDRHKQALAVLTNQVASLTAENQDLRKILMYLASKLPNVEPTK